MGWEMMGLDGWWGFCLDVVGGLGSLGIGEM